MNNLADIDVSTPFRNHCPFCNEERPTIVRHRAKNLHKDEGDVVTVCFICDHNQIWTGPDAKAVLRRKLTEVETLDPRHDASNDEMRFPYPFTGKADAEVRVRRGAMVQGEAWVKARIEGWFINHDTPKRGQSLRIPDEQFDSTKRQPERQKAIRRRRSERSPY